MPEDVTKHTLDKGNALMPDWRKRIATFPVMDMKKVQSLRKLVALDQFGSVLAQTVIYLIGRPERKSEAESTVNVAI